MRVWGIKFGTVGKNSTNVFNIMCKLVNEKKPQSLWGCMRRTNNTLKGHQCDLTMGFIFPFIFV